MAAALIILPVKKIQNIVEKLFKRKFIKGAVCALLILTAFGTVPETSTEPLIDEISSQAASTSLVQIADRTLSVDLTSKTEDLSLDTPLLEAKTSDAVEPFKESESIDPIQLDQDKNVISDTSSVNKSIDNGQPVEETLIVKNEVHKEPITVIEKDSDKQVLENTSPEKQSDVNVSDAEPIQPVVVDKKSEKTVEPDASVTTDTNDVNPPTKVSTPVSTEYIGNLNTKKFHYASCNDVKKMKESNKFKYKGTREDMLSMGYSPCGHCHP